MEQPDRRKLDAVLNQIHDQDVKCIFYPDFAKKSIEGMDLEDDTLSRESQKYEFLKRASTPATSYIFMLSRKSWKETILALNEEDNLKDFIIPWVHVSVDIDGKKKYYVNIAVDKPLTNTEQGEQ